MKTEGQRVRDQVIEPYILKSHEQDGTMLEVSSTYYIPRATMYAIH